MPSFAPLYCYSQHRTNVVAGNSLRYPSDRPALGEAFSHTYKDFVLRAVRSAPVPVVVTTDIDEVPWHFKAAKRDAYLHALADFSYATSVTRVYEAFVKQEILYGPVKAPRIIKAHSKVANLAVWPYLHAFEVSLLSILDQDGLPFFAKGADFTTRARIVEEKSRGRVTYSLDMSSFDNSVRGGFYLGEIRAFKDLFGLAFDEEAFLQPLL